MGRIEDFLGKELKPVGGGGGGRLSSAENKVSSERRKELPKI